MTLRLLSPRTTETGPDRGGPQCGRLATGFVVWFAFVLAACGGSPEQRVAADVDDQEGAAGASAADAGTTGTVLVRLEPVAGVFIEGFEVGLRFETTDGEVIAATLWSDFVQSLGRTDLDAFYDSVLTQPVPPGVIRVLAEANVGMGPGPVIPDLEGDLPCEVTLDVGPNTEVVVEVSFDGSDDCLHVIPSEDSSREQPSIEPTSTTVSTTTAPPSFDVGTSHQVDVDLECQAFELGDAIWVLSDGDTSGWQPPGERHEGGTFTIESEGKGRFSGDAEGRKTATFERLDDSVEPSCVPVPRPAP